MYGISVLRLNLGCRRNDLDYYYYFIGSLSEINSFVDYNLNCVMYANKYTFIFSYSSLDVIDISVSCF